MSWRVVLISSHAKLDLKMEYLVVREQETVTRIHISEIAVMIVETTAVSLTVCLLSELAKRKVRVVFCDEKRNPQLEVVPYYGSHDASDKLRKQIRWDTDLKAKVWAEIVRKKIDNQSQVLTLFGKEKESLMLQKYCAEIQQGDVTNREAHAAKVYFNSLFSLDFSRDLDCAENAAMNYGYAIVLSTINREISIAGYVTQLGLFHDNTFNYFNLGCDLMEPFRPLVDWIVITGGIHDRFEQEEKRSMLRLFDLTLKQDGENKTFLVAVRDYVRSVFTALTEGDVLALRFATYEF